MNAAQTKHLVGTLRAVALAQLITFGYDSLAVDNWFGFNASVIFTILLEFFSLLLLRGVPDA